MDKKTNEDTIDCSDLVGTYTLNEMPELLNKLQVKIDTLKNKNKSNNVENLEYLIVRVYSSGRVKTLKTTKRKYEWNVGKLTTYYISPRESYDYFYTTNYTLRKDCAKYFKVLMNELDAEQKVLNKKRAKIEKMISNSKEL